MQPQNKQQQKRARTSTKAITHTSCGTAKGNTNTLCMQKKKNNKKTERKANKKNTKKKKLKEKQLNRLSAKNNSDNCKHCWDSDLRIGIPTRIRIRFGDCNGV